MSNKRLVAVVGGGIAAFVARSALRAAGFRVLALVGTEPPIAPERLLVCPRLQRGESPHARFLRDAYQEAIAFYERPPHDKAIVARGALRLAQSEQEQARWRALAEELPHFCHWFDAIEAQRKSGLRKDATRWGGIFLPHALVLAPRRLFVEDETNLKVSVLRMTRDTDGGWRLFTKAKAAASEEVVRAGGVVLALGAHLPAFLRGSVFLRPSQHLPQGLPQFFLQNLLQNLRTGRGRLDFCDGAALDCPPLLPVCGSGWVMPYPRGRVGVVRGLAPSRAARGGEENRKRLVEWCGLSEDGIEFEQSYEALRLSTRDRLPLLGEAGFLGEGGLLGGLFLFGGLGGHGFLTAPLCGRGLVGLLGGEDVAQDGLAFLSPQRFLS